MFYDFLIIYLIIINLVSVVITAKDKLNAIAHKTRISEFMLMFVASMGGSIFMFLTMLIIRHKIRHPKFMYGIPFIIVIQLLLLAFILEKI